MSVGKKRRKAVTVVTEAQPQKVELKGFFDGAGTFTDFAFAKYYWLGQGPRPGIADCIERKLHPGSGLDGQPSNLNAAKWELLVPAFAPEDHADLEFCIYTYDRSFSPSEVNAYVQLTFRFPVAMNLHHPYEMVRAFVRAEIVDGAERNLPVVLVLHKPQAAGSYNDSHVHAIVLLRRLNQLGWAAYDKSLPTDAGNRDIHDAWLAFKKRWTEEWPEGLIQMPM